MSAGGRLLAYRDTQYRLHLVETAAGTDRVLGPGVEPRFSADGRYLAYITGDSLPLPKSPERLMVYALSTGASLRLGPFVLPRVGLGWDATSTLLAWSPRADALAWPELGTPKPSITVATFDGGSTFQLATVVPTKLAGEVTWADDGHGLLFWSGEEYGTAQGRPVGYLNLLRQEVPGRATRVLVAAVPTAWFEGLAPAPVPGPGDRVYASLLGEPPVNLNLLVLYVPGQHARGISLSGEPRLARFAPAGGQLLVIWTPPYGSRIFGSQASLIDVQTGHVRNLGPAVAAFWT